MNQIILKDSIEINRVIQHDFFVGYVFYTQHSIVSLIVVLINVDMLVSLMENVL